VPPIPAVARGHPGAATIRIELPKIAVIDTRAYLTSNS
jgi:hypothetical protein